MKELIFKDGLSVVFAAISRNDNTWLGINTRFSVWQDIWVLERGR